MNLVLELDDISTNNIFFYDSVKNTVMNDSSFIRVIYSNNDVILNGIYIKIDLYKDIKIKNLNNISITSDIISKVDKIENNILTQYNSLKTQNNKLRDQLIYHINKINNTNTNDNLQSYLLKISGIWETDTVIGLTYKFIYIHE